MYITREIEHEILTYFAPSRPKGLILAGIVGCGKTTLVERVLEQLQPRKRILRYSGDDITFRSTVAIDSKLIYNDIVANATAGIECLVFVDEVQKSENIFDALKYAFDHAQASFIVSGSNPAYLATIARKRLQRRADFKVMMPFSMPEILNQSAQLPLDKANFFSHLIFEAKTPEMPSFSLQITPEMNSLIKRYLTSGGLPLAHLSTGLEAFVEIRQTVERGFEPILVDTEGVHDIILVELAKLHAKEFTYTNIFKRTGIRRRDQINEMISALKDHSYLLTKKPFFFDAARKSYLSVHSFIDPGILSYLLGEQEIEDNIGQRIEGVVHSRLRFLMQTRPFKNELGYYKPFRADGDHIKFLPGEIDFIYVEGRRHIPVEVKTTVNLPSIDTKLIEATVEKEKCPFGLVLYSGVPYLAKKQKIMYWPWWLI